MKRRKLIIIITGLMMIIYVTITQILGNSKLKTDYNNFYSSKIIGTLTEIGIKKHGVGFRINDDSVLYVFYPYTSILNQNNIIYQLAEKGDSIIKSQYQDTLILIKKGKRYLYTFRKFK